MMLKILSAGLIGSMTGFLTVRILPSSGFDLLLWIFVGILLGLWTLSKEEVIWCGLSFGSFVTMSFLYSGFQGNNTHLISFLILSIILAFVGACGGFVLTFTGNLIRKQF